MMIDARPRPRQKSPALSLALGSAEACGTARHSSIASNPSGPRPPRAAGALLHSGLRGGLCRCLCALLSLGLTALPGPSRAALVDLEQPEGGDGEADAPAKAGPPKVGPPKVGPPKVGPPKAGPPKAGPTGDESAADDPTADESAADDPTADDPTADESAADDPTADEPTADKPTAEKPTADDRSADEPETPPARASLEVDASTIGAQSPVLLRRIEELGDIELRRAEILPSRQPNDPVLKIAILAIDDGGYAIRSHLQVDGKIVANSEREVLCTLCTEGETVERARIEVDRLIPFVRDHARAEAEARARAAAEQKRLAEANAAPTDRPPLPPKSKAGIALLATGSAGLGLGFGLALREPTVKPEMPLETVDTRIPGYVALGVGGALVLSGVALLILGQRSARASTLTLAPTLRGAVLIGRF